MSLATNNYEYMNEDTINDELKCTICTQPFLSPVSLECQHTFCQLCIDTWIKQNTSCPICRCQCGTGYTVTIYSMYHELDSLPVRCLRCDKSDIQRGNFEKHFQLCSKNKMTVPSNLLRNRWNSMKTRMRASSRRPATPRQTTVIPATEVVDTNQEQAANLYREVLDVHSQYSRRQQFSNPSTRIPRELMFPRAAAVRPYEPIQNSYSQEDLEWKRKAFFCIRIVIVAIWVLIMLKAVINVIFNVWGTAIIVILVSWLWKKLVGQTT